ncbi:MAG: hypothetical protein H6713_12455 [Myxococcales bacterium]|nr:hypothetical protein [Myxococcales bacterium]MCB9750789.1 hypothetical protein [Myxococcales bacterium]
MRTRRHGGRRRGHASALLGTTLLGAAASLWSPRASADEGEAPLLVVLDETGESRDGRPVLTRHPAPEAATSVLTRGLAGALVRAYAMEQEYLRRAEQRAPEPAYILLSSRQGGFAREGFWLDDEDKPEAGYVDLHRDWPLTGKFGSVDQLFPHELTHVIRRQLAGELQDGGTNQVHALGVRTDRVVAFNEGFAEAVQALAVDHPDAAPSTAALAGDQARVERVERQLAAYRRELTARVALATRMRLGFLIWYSDAEDVLRYHAVKANAFARAPAIPERLLTADPYAAYLLESVLPGRPEDPLKSRSRMLASEGVISALMLRWLADEELGASRRGADFYARFGVTADQVTPLENALLKLFHALHEHKPRDLVALVDGYRALFPDEAPRVDALLRDVLGAPRGDAPPELWLANRAFKTGTTVFDQHRALPRVHTFDLNGASLVDLVGVPGVDIALARSIRAHAPYASLDELDRVPGLTGDQRDALRGLASELAALRAELEDEGEDAISIGVIITPFVWRALAALALAGALGTLITHLTRPQPRPPRATSRAGQLLRAAAVGFAAAFLGVFVGWAQPLAGAGSLLAVLVLAATPAAVWAGRRAGDIRYGLRVGLVWLLAALPAAALVSPW